jgi:hypothetical protein
MRHWLFHPLLFYPLAALIAAFVIVVSLQPQAWPRDPAPVSAERDGQWLVFQGEAFNSPAVDEDKQEMTVSRDFFGRARTLSIAQKPTVPAPTPQDQGARILLSAEDAAALSGRPVTIEVSYNPLPINAATGLAVSLRGEGPSAWVSQPAPPQSATLRFQLPARGSVNAIGLRALSEGADQAYGLEITRIRVTPHA